MSVLDGIKDAIASIDAAYRELEDVLETEDIENKNKWTVRAMSYLELASEKLEGR